MREIVHRSQGEMDRMLRHWRDTGDVILHPTRGHIESAYVGPFKRDGMRAHEAGGDLARVVGSIEQQLGL